MVYRCNVMTVWQKNLNALVEMLDCCTKSQLSTGLDYRKRYFFKNIFYWSYYYSCLDISLLAPLHPVPHFPPAIHPLVYIHVSCM